MSMEQRKLPTVLDLRALKGQKQLTMLRYFSLDEAAAAEAKTTAAAESNAALGAARILVRPARGG